MPELFEGNLTATVHLSSAEHAGASENISALRELVHAMSEQAGRVVFGGWPTGASITPAMQHGGPWPATTNDSSTAVGSAAIARFLRPIAFQNAPAAFLPSPLREENPWGLRRSVSAAGESVTWGQSVDAAATVDSSLENADQDLAFDAESPELAETRD